MNKEDRLNKKKEELKNRFTLRIQSGKSIKYKDIKKEDPTLLFAIEKSFGGIFNIAKSIGLTEDDLINKHGLTRNINKKTLTEDEILNRLTYLKSMGKLTTSAMRTEFNDFRLETSIKKLYGSVENGLIHFDMKRDTVRHTKKSLEKDIRNLYNKNIDLSYTNILNSHPLILHNAINKFNKGWYSILDDFSIPYVALRRSFSKEKIRDRLYDLKAVHGEVNFEIIRKYDSSILYYAYDNYDSVIDFYIDMDMNPNECMDFSKQTIKGFEFERVFKEVLDLLGVSHRHNKHFNKKIRPDFQLDNNVWIDCKLSSWTSSIESTINKYTPHCDKLIIVFLRGKEDYAKEYKNDKVEIRKIDYYYPFLKEVNRHDLIERFENIVNNNFIESVTTERSIS